MEVFIGEAGPAFFFLVLLDECVGSLDVAQSKLLAESDPPLLFKGLLGCSSEFILIVLFAVAKHALEFLFVGFKDALDVIFLVYLS